MLITSVTKDEKQSRYTIYLDNGYSFSISEDDYLSMSLYSKHELTEDEVRNIRESIIYREARYDGIRYLSLKHRCEKEVIDKLSRNGYDNDIIDRVIDDLRSMGYLNDRLYAEKYIYDRLKLKPKSKKMLKFELMHKGVEEAIIDEVLADYEIDEQALAESLIMKKYAKYDLSDEKIIRRIQNFLYHKGFDFNQIAKTLENIKKQS